MNLPDIFQDIQPRQELLDFTKIMEYKLQQNDDKGGWNGSPYGYLLSGIHRETSELSHSLTHGTLFETLCECSDVANFAMMIADNAIGDAEPNKENEL